jgi:hypothetical protein
MGVHVMKVLNVNFVLHIRVVMLVADVNVALYLWNIGIWFGGLEGWLVAELLMH